MFDIFRLYILRYIKLEPPTDNTVKNV